MAQGSLPSSACRAADLPPDPLVPSGDAAKCSSSCSRNPGLAKRGAGEGRTGGKKRDLPGVQRCELMERPQRGCRKRQRSPSLLWETVGDPKTPPTCRTTPSWIHVVSPWPGSVLGPLCWLHEDYKVMQRLPSPLLPSSQRCPWWECLLHQSPAPFTPVPAPSFSSSKCFVCAVKTCGPVEMLHIKGLQPHMATQLEKENVALIAHPAAVTERCLTEMQWCSLLVGQQLKDSQPCWRRDRTKQ
nr:uncharacterized protein LOC119717883 [Anas platyrhynchos]